MILLSPDKGAGPADVVLPVLFACRVDFLTPPTGAAVEVAPLTLGLVPRRTLRRRDWRWETRISSSDLSSLPDMVAGVAGI